ncbi:MAG: addiction module antidote protein, HigA family [Desulfovibrionales bacterium]|nr:MAG: addiction module antidote protein, HigA family [Desulfovibrionales bacterium]
MPFRNTTPRTIAPTHPGEMLREDFMPDYGLNTTALAASLGVTRQTVNELIRCRRAITPLMALRLSRLFGNSPRFWLNAQQAVDLWDLEATYHGELEAIPRLEAEKDESKSLASTSLSISEG